MKTPESRLNPVAFLLPQSRFLRLLLLFSAIVFIGGAILTVPSVSEGLARTTSTKPEPFTELYFVNHTKLPKTVVAGKLSQFTFNVTNHEAKTVAYRIRVTQVENEKHAVIREYAFSLNNGQNKKFTTPFTIRTPAANVQLIVELIDQHTSIHFRSHS